MLIFKGEVLGRYENKFTDKDTGKETITKKVQVLEVNNGRREITEIKLKEDENISKFKQGSKIMIPIKLFTPKDKDTIYISQNGDIQIQEK